MSLQVHAAGLPFQKKRSFYGELNAAEARSDIQRSLSLSLARSQSQCISVLSSPSVKSASSH